MIKTILATGIVAVIIIIGGVYIYKTNLPPSITTTIDPTIQQLNAPGNVSLQQNGIAEIRNQNFYFTLQSLSRTSATIQITPVGCWNSFPSDTPPQMRCMIAVRPIPLQTLLVGQTYTATNYSITLTQINNGTAVFLVTNIINTK